MGGIVFEENFFRLKNVKNLYFWLFMTKNTLNLVSQLSSIKLETPMIAQNISNEILQTMDKIFQFYRLKTSKNLIFLSSWQKIH